MNATVAATTTPTHRPVPDFIKEMKNLRKEVNLHTHFRHHQVGAEPFPARTIMRAMNIVGAFAKRKPITIVESASINNRPFLDALQFAVYFMRETAEANINREFDEWVIENLIDDNENDIMIIYENDKYLVL